LETFACTLLTFHHEWWNYFHSQRIFAINSLHNQALYFRFFSLLLGLAVFLWLFAIYNEFHVNRFIWCLGNGNNFCFGEKTADFLFFGGWEGCIIVRYAYKENSLLVKLDFLFSAISRPFYVSLSVFCSDRTNIKSDLPEI